MLKVVLTREDAIAVSTAVTPVPLPAFQVAVKAVYCAQAPRADQQDFYEVSLTDGFNLPMRITSNVCPTVSCAVDLNAVCPTQLRGATNAANQLVGCNNACTANLDGNPGNSSNCCTGSHGTPATCPASGVEFYSFFNVSFHKLETSTQGLGNVLLVTAHPDDECMFFAPTLLALRRDSSGKTPEIHSLCLSTGDADGLGDVRSLELEGSLDILGVKKENRKIVDHPKLKDNFTTTWDAEVIADFVWQYVTAHHITAILTFDEDGVSGHPNHKSIPHAVLQLAKDMDSPHASVSIAPRVFTLVSTPLLRKYIGPVDAVFTKMITSKDSMTFVSHWRDYFRAISAMRAHQSQLVWFRYLYVTFSRYMWVNEWKELEVASQ
ncbi:hypothetical protein ONZ45_g10640 [Pleurotus djamor]|nr:hypothetical protein ONZ45_g10640 [Pleurotus djamor]